LRPAPGRLELDTTPLHIQRPFCAITDSALWIVYVRAAEGKLLLKGVAPRPRQAAWLDPRTGEQHGGRHRSGRAHASLAGTCRADQRRLGACLDNSRGCVVCHFGLTGSPRGRCGAASRRQSTRGFGSGRARRQRRHGPLSNDDLFVWEAVAEGSANRWAYVRLRSCLARRYTVRATRSRRRLSTS
jgi:hypothetical protein